MEIALVTFSEIPELTPDDQRVIAPLAALGIEARAVVWDDEAVDWSRFRLAILRETWDYFVRPREFEAWLARASLQVEIHNAPALVRWNTHKGYLIELADRGLPVTPTRLCRRETSLRDLGWGRVVVKPAISGGARLTRSFDASDPEGEAHLALVLQEGDALVQPYLPALDRDGERSYMFIDGQFTHAVARAPTMGATGGVPDGVAMDPRVDEVALSHRVLAAVPGTPLYARVDLATGEDGPLLQEIELIEPRLFLGAAEDAATQFARAIARLATR